MAGVEHQIFELVRLIHKQMVDAHLLEVRHVIGTLLDGVGKLFQLGFQVELAFLQAFQQFGGLGYLAELVMRHDDAVVVVVPDIIEEPDTVSGGEVLFRSVEDAGVGIGGLVSGRYLRHVRFQPDNHRLVSQLQPLHFMRRNAHYQCLTGPHLVVTKATAVLFQHPYAILLAGINA